MFKNITRWETACVYGFNVQKITGVWEELYIEELHNFTIYILYEDN
jgi:hypothetical protein